MELNIFDSALAASVASASSQYAALSLLLDAFPGSSIKIKPYLGAAQRGTGTAPKPTINTTTTPLRLTFGKTSAWSPLQNVQADNVVLCTDTGVAVCSLPAAAFAAPWPVDSKPDLTAIVLEAKASLPKFDVGNLDFQSILLPPSADYDLRQPTPVASVTITALPNAGSLIYKNGAAEVAVTNGATLTPSQFDTLFYRSGATLGSVGSLGYSLGGVAHTVAMSVIAWDAMCDARSARLRIFAAATGGSPLFEGTVAFGAPVADSLGNFKSGPLASPVATIGYQYYSDSPLLDITAPASKAGGKIGFTRWWTPSNGTIEVECDFYPNAAGKYPFRSDSRNVAWNPASDARQLLFCEIDILDVNGNVYAKAGERSGRLRGTTTGADETRVTITAAAGAWWWNKKPTILPSWNNNKALVYPERPDDQTDYLSVYANSNGASTDGIRGNFNYDPEFSSSGPFWGYKGPGISGSMELQTWGGGQTHNRQPYPEVALAMLAFGPDHVRAFTTNGAHTFGDMMLSVAECSANGMPVRYRSHFGAGPFDEARYGAAFKNMSLCGASPNGAVPYWDPVNTGYITPFPPGGMMDHASGSLANGWQIDQAHAYCGTEVAYATTGCVRYFMAMQFAAVASLLTYNPANRRGLVVTKNEEVVYRSWQRPYAMLLQAGLLAPLHPDARWLPKSRILAIVAEAWVEGDLRLAEAEAATSPEGVFAWKAGLRSTQLSNPTDSYGEAVGPYLEETTQVNWLNKPPGSVVYGFHTGGTWDAVYGLAALILAKRHGLINDSHLRFMKKMTRYAVGCAYHCPSALGRHPSVLVDMCTQTGASPITDWTLYLNATNIFDTGAIPQNGTTLGAAALGGTPAANVNPWAWIAARRGETTAGAAQVATGVIDQKQSRNYAIYLWLQWLRAMQIEFPFVFDDPQISAMAPTVLAYVDRSYNAMIKTVKACRQVFNPAVDPVFRKVARTDLATSDPVVNGLQGILYSQWGQWIFSTKTSSTAFPYTGGPV